MTTVDLKELWFIHGRAYDLTSFLKAHPGGTDVLLQVKGQDSTALFESMHPAPAERPRALLAALTEVTVPADVLAVHLATLTPSTAAPVEEGIIVSPLTMGEEVKMEEGWADKTTEYADVDPDELWYIHGKAYDLRDFIKDHPGGRSALVVTQGRDCTAMFESYHAFVQRPHELLKTFKEVKLPPNVLASRVTDVSERGWFYLPDGRMDPFWLAVKERCGKKLKELGQPRTTPWWEVLLCYGVLAAFALIYTFGYLNPIFLIAASSAVVLGVMGWGLSRMSHDGYHYALSRIGWFNSLSAFLGAIFTSSPGIWEIVHNVGHHTESNQDTDPDMWHFMTWIRVRPEFKGNFWHRLQTSSFYVYGVQSFAVFGLTTVEPIRMLTTGSALYPPMPGASLIKNRPIFWVAMAAHLLLFWFMGVIVPFIVKYDYHYDEAWWNHKVVVLLGQLLLFGIYQSAAGWLYGVFTQISHFAEGCVEATNKHTSWAVQQVETACNYAPKSRFWDFMSNGVNIQIEHHLFPSLASSRTRPLVPIVEATCREFGVEYRSFPSFWSCLASNRRYIGSLALKDGKAHGPTATSVQA